MDANAEHNLIIRCRQGDEEAWRLLLAHYEAPALAGMSQIPGPRQLTRLARATGGRLPDIMRGISSVLGTVARRRRD